MSTCLRKACLLFTLALSTAFLLAGCGGSPSSGLNPGPGPDVPDIAIALNYLKASNAGRGDRFGHSVALSGDGTTLAVGARGEDSGATGINGNLANPPLENSGAVYIFLRSGDTWVQQAYLKADVTDAQDVFGTSVSLSADGHTLAVGAIGEDGDATGNPNINPLDDAGAVYVFTRSGNSWSQKDYVKADNPDMDDKFGYSVALSGDGKTLAVGAISEDSPGTGINPQQGNDPAFDSAGAVYVFARNGDDWDQEAYVKASNTGAGDMFGFSVSLSDNGRLLAVGAVNESSNATGTTATVLEQGDDSLPGAGAVYVFNRGAGGWSQQAYVKASNPDPLDQFGHSVTLSSDGQTLAVGAIGEDSSATGTVGSIGQQSDNAFGEAGAVYVFASSAGVWSQQAYVKASNTKLGDWFGTSTALSANGNVLAVGARNESSNAVGTNGDQANTSAFEAGAVYAFTRNGTGVWRQLAYIKASNTHAGAWFGWSLALAADGGTLAVGAPGESSNATGVNGNQANVFASNTGAVYVRSIALN